MGAPIDRTAKTVMDLNLVNGVTSDAPKLKASDNVLYDYVDGLNAAQDAHSQAATLAHPDGSVKTAKIADGAVTTAKIADGAVTTPKIPDGAITAPKIPDGILTSAKFVPGVLTNETANGLQIVALKEGIATKIPTAYDFGILPNQSGYIDNTKLQTFFAFCQANNIPAQFDAGTYNINGDNFQIPDYGMIGKGRYTTVFNITPVNVANYVFKFGVDGGWTTIKGNIQGIRFVVPDDSAAKILYISTPTRAFQVSDVTFHIGTGDCVTLYSTFYAHFKDVVFEGFFNQNMPTNTTDMLKGVAIRNLGAEVNNITFTKCDFRFLSMIWDSPTTAFQGSNSILFTGCAMEYIGDCAFNTSGFRIEFDTCYFESLDRNQNVTGRPNAKTTILIYGGTGRSSFSNCLVNLTSVRSTAYMIHWVVGAVTFNGGSITSIPTGFVMMEPVTFSSRGILIDNGCEGLAQQKYAIIRYGQQHTLQYPNALGEEVFSPVIAESKYAKSSLIHQSMASPQAFSFQTVQPIVSIEGESDTSSHMVEIDVTLYRFVTATSTVGWKHLIIRFLINSDMPATITPTIETVSSGGDQAGFSDTNILTKIVAARRTPARTTGVVYPWHYQVYINGETGGATGRILASRVHTNIIWIAKGATDTTHPSYGIFPQSNIFGSAIT